MTKSIMLVGVGGQGTILASRLLTIGLMSAGYDVKMSEIHGMSQRGGSVSSQVRYSKDKVYAPVIERGGADILVAFEKVEAMRSIPYLKTGGKVVVNNFEMESVTTIIGEQNYPSEIVEELQEKVDVTIVDAANLAENLGNTKVMNVILLGSLVKSMELDEIDWDTIIEQNVKPKFVELNKKAFKVGLDNA